MKDSDLKISDNFTIEVKDAEIWQSFKNGDERALTFIYNQNFDSLYLYGIKLAEDPELVKDAIQNLFLQLWHNRQNLRTPENIKPYLFKALRNHILISMKQVKAHSEINLFLQQETGLVFSEEEILLTEKIAQKQSQAINAVLEKLTKRQREVIALKFYEGLSYEKVAEIMDLNVQSVRNLIYQAIKILKASLLFLVCLSWLLT